MTINIRKLESDLWESADLLRAESKLTSNQYCMPVLGLLFLRYAYSRFKLVEKEILVHRPVRNGRVLPVEASDFKEKSAGDRRKLIKILLVMYYAHASSKLKESAREMLSSVF